MRKTNYLRLKLKDGNKREMFKIKAARQANGYDACTEMAEIQVLDMMFPFALNTLMTRDQDSVHDECCVMTYLRELCHLSMCNQMHKTKDVTRRCGRIGRSRVSGAGDRQFKPMIESNQ